jgi:hypothetical protein
MRGTYVSQVVVMLKRIFAIAGGLAVAVAFTGCEAAKSSNPLAPTVAGPIPGVNITAPAVVDPSSGTKIPMDKQPITLTVVNASTSGVRPLSYVFDVATDAGFTNKVFSRDGIAPGDGRTSLRLPDALATGRSYYWRARAQDGANTGPYTAPINFNVFTPVVIDVPNPILPLANSTVDGIRPTFVVRNAARSGPAGAISYQIELADSESFANKLAVWTQGEQATQTSLATPIDLAPAKVYYWHARAFDPTTVGPWCRTLAFTTPATSGGPAPGAPPPVVTGPAPGDAINLNLASVYNSPPDIASWPATGTITNLTMSGAGLSFAFTTSNSWPDVVPPGFSGPLEYTVWAVVNVNGSWATSGFIQMWRGRASTGAPILAEFALNWAYDARWGPMNHYQPHAGEQMGFFLSAGNARGETGVSSVKQRTNVVLVSLPGGDSGVFNFSSAFMPFRR